MKVCHNLVLAWYAGKENGIKCQEIMCGLHPAKVCQIQMQQVVRNSSISCDSLKFIS